MSSIIHFTGTFEILKNIIATKKLLLHYCKEDFCLGEKKVSRAAHPMISFSEFNVKYIDNRIITYGKYGIAFSKTWVIKNRIHPVLYIDRDSLIAESLANLLVARRKTAEEQLTAKVKLSIMNIKCFVKNARGYNSYLNKKNFDFKKENEWRFVPTKSQIDGKLISQSRTKYLDRQEYYNKKLYAYPLGFLVEDIEYVFVENKGQAKELSQLISGEIEKIRVSKWKLK